MSTPISITPLHDPAAPAVPGATTEIKLHQKSRILEVAFGLFDEGDIERLQDDYTR